MSTVLLTHLHLDHVSWIMHEGTPFFSSAGSGTEARTGRRWSTVRRKETRRPLMKSAAAAGILRPAAPGSEEVLPGVTTTHVPGHTPVDTPGHRTVELRSRGQRIVFVGDLVELPAQLRDGTVHFMTDHHRHQAAGARTALFSRAKAEGIVFAPAHLTDPTFGTISDDDR
ncbi:MBL fold metallo-hydrolase [Curtobacterium sp. MCLR17_034]|uniref:MBL fold metallo-hydrolase n=1 Tax=Curtobacterium sp. MCLR17_034 TaxID=2175623 RepID=UPI000DA9259E|nr:MBL fold metallo-hydrolase [Curtobacterium sp. MCLR17_034]PZF13205.1 hypothetical protein DEI98_04175 [Curtobacterium sp. MCLR17_034]